MPRRHISRLRLALPLLCFALCGACGGDSEDDVDESAAGSGGQPPMREGPEGCYIEANFACNCELDQAACTADVGIWTPGCASCAP
jgi:hypothetical protein